MTSDMNFGARALASLSSVLTVAVAAGAAADLALVVGVSFKPRKSRTSLMERRRKRSGGGDTKKTSRRPVVAPALRNVPNACHASSHLPPAEQLYICEKR